MRFSLLLPALPLMTVLLHSRTADAAEMPPAVRGVLEKRCYDCHADGAKKGGVALDAFKSEAELLADKTLWHRVLKNVRAGLMPPPEKEQPSAEERGQLQQWIKAGVFAQDTAQPDPGRPVLRRLNRAEYRNTIEDLTGVDFRVQDEFPTDDSGHGFDNIGEVLTVSPMLLEKYLAAAQTIVAEAVAKHRDKLLPGNVPAESEPRRAYARERLSEFTARAFRRPVQTETVDRLLKLAEPVWTQAGKSFEDGMSRAFEAVLSSPRFLFREEFTESLDAGQKYALVDEFSMASRLSYFLWSTMPDAELLRLAGEGKLRAEMDAQFERMLKSDRTLRGFVRNFSGQWLETRDIESVPIDARFVLMREQKPDPEADAARKRFFELRRKREDERTKEEEEELRKARETFRRVFNRFEGVEFRRDVRQDMRRETEMYFTHILREGRPLTELLASDYTFLNERLAKHYGVPGVTGDEIRKVTLPADSPRGGILTQGSVLAVTSNPTRTSPVKRGLFILDNILGTPPPPPPPDVPPLEDNARGRGFEGTLRQNLERHRADAKCASCHNRMDPLGLAFENFNAMGQWRELERGQNVDAGGKLVSGETFTGARELKQILVSKHREAFYRCFTEKLLTYSLGRGLDWRDEQTVDVLLEKLNQSDGRMLPLLRAVVDSPAFQRRRAAP